MPELANNRMPISNVSKGLHRFAVATASCTVLLLMAGALVTSNDAADSVPDWPLAYGKIIPPMVGGIRYEFTHRVMAGTVAILTAILAIWLARKGSRFLRNLGWTALGLVIAQAILGGLRVLFHDPALPPRSTPSSRKFSSSPSSASRYSPAPGGIAASPNSMIPARPPFATSR